MLLVSFFISQEKHSMKQLKSKKSYCSKLVGFIEEMRENYLTTSGDKEVLQTLFHYCPFLQKLI